MGQEWIIHLILMIVVKNVPHQPIRLPPHQPIHPHLHRRLHPRRRLRLPPHILRRRQIPQPLQPPPDLALHLPQLILSLLPLPLNRRPRPYQTLLFQALLPHLEPQLLQPHYHQIPTTLLVEAAVLFSAAFLPSRHCCCWCWHSCSISYRSEPRPLSPLRFFLSFCPSRSYGDLKVTTPRGAKAGGFSEARPLNAPSERGTLFRGLAVQAEGCFSRRCGHGPDSSHRSTHASVPLS